MASLSLSSPWQILYKEIDEMFKDDPKVRVLFDDENKLIKIFAEGLDKYLAINELMIPEHVFGNVKVRVEVVAPNETFKDGRATGKDLIEYAFEGNDALDYVKTITTPFGTFKYVVFRNKVVQYFNDDFSDIHGFASTLYATIAKKIFKPDSSVFYCTNVPENVALPLGEWP